jgi:hypothetical protein
VGIRTPNTAAVAHPDDIPAGLGDRFVVKPLGVGNFWRDDEAYSAPSQVVRRGDSRLDGLSIAPFLIQSRVEARTHLRVVTVKRQAWTCALDADGLPLDWRQHEQAHQAWRPTVDIGVETDAAAVATELGLGYSSQDWIVDHDGESWLVDINPAGQWLFLPARASDPITDAIAGWLTGADG